VVTYLAMAAVVLVASALWFYMTRRQRRRNPQAFGISILTAYMTSVPSEMRIEEAAYEELFKTQSLAEVRNVIHRYPLLAILPTDKFESMLIKSLPPDQVLKARQLLRWFSFASAEVLELIEPALESFKRSFVYHQLRSAVESFPFLQSQFFRNLYLSFLVKDIPEDFCPLIVYQFKWIENYYGKPSPISDVVASSSQATGKFPSIKSGLGPAVSDSGACRTWAHEAERAFDWAQSLEDMGVVAAHYPILLMPTVQAGIDYSITKFDEPTRIQYQKKVRYLEILREQIQGHPVESWWRTVERNAHRDDNTID
jgi:hypothetical protein